MTKIEEIPQVKIKINSLYFEYSKIKQKDKCITIYQKDSEFSIPAATISNIMLGPGTSITHKAIQLLSENNCQIQWVGENSIRLYASGSGGTNNSKNLIKQACLFCDKKSRRIIAKKMYEMRFGKTLPQNYSIEQMRGKEGTQIKKIYKEMSKKYNVPWEGRKYDPKNFFNSDLVNQLLSCSNVCLYGLSHAVILSLGYSPSLGFIHIGRHDSFVYDIADLYKIKYTIPLSFEMASLNELNSIQKIRQKCRDVFNKENLAETIVNDLQHIFDVNIDVDKIVESGYDVANYT